MTDKATKKYKWIFVFCCMVFCFTSCGEGDTGNWYDRYPVVCHALGKTEQGDTLTNSLEAFEYNYSLGQKVFEADCSITSDNVVVLRHDWDCDLGQSEAFGWTDEVKEAPDCETFLKTPIYGKYTPLTLLDLYQIMDEHKDMYVVLDPKYSPDVKGQFTLIVNTALDNGYESVLERLIIQLYYEEMYEEVEKVYSFKNYIYTLYYIGFPGGEEVGGFCQEKGIPVLVMPYTWISPEILQSLEPYQLKLYVHTVDETMDAQRMAESQVDGIYSDVITPEQMREIMKEAGKTK